MADDPELKAISSIISVLTPLDETGRSRVLEYVLKRLDMAAVQPGAFLGDERKGFSADGNSSSAGNAHLLFKDIRTLTAEKQPRSANEMVALIAYYLSELAANDQRLETVNVETIRKYFKMAGFPMPRVPKNALTNATAAGYLENVSRGEYRLNPVGYNLIVHGLPRNGSPGPNNQSKLRRNRK